MDKKTFGLSPKVGRELFDQEMMMLDLGVGELFEAVFLLERSNPKRSSSVVFFLLLFSSCHGVGVDKRDSSGLGNHPVLENNDKMGLTTLPCRDVQTLSQDLVGFPLLDNLVEGAPGEFYELPLLVLDLDPERECGLFRKQWNLGVGGLADALCLIG